MATNQDTNFAGRFPDITAATFYGSNVGDLAGYKPAESKVNAGMLADIGRVTVFGPETQSNPYSKFIRSPLSRGDSAMTARFSQVNSKAYDPLAADSALFDGTRPSMISQVTTKNLSRQVRVEINDRWMKQFAQTEEMIGDAAAAIMATSNACYMDDMYAASNEYFSGSVRGAQASQMITLKTTPSEDGFAAEMSETLWDITQNKFKFKSTAYNKSKYNTKTENASIIMDKSCVFPTFKRQYADVFNPDYLDISTSSGYVDSFATTAGKPASSGNLLAIVADNRAFDIIPMPEALSVESFRNPARKSTMYATTYEYALGQNPFVNCVYIFAKGSA